MPEPLQARKSGPIAGAVSLPGDKSVSHRALILGALASGETVIRGLLCSEDVMASAAVLRAMGAAIAETDDHWRVRGRGVGGLVEPTGVLDFANSGTGTRLMMGVITGHDMTARLVGDASLSRRPMDRVLDPLTRMGLEVSEPGNGAVTLPLELRGSDDPIAISYELPVPSAQIKSAILLAGLHASGETTVIERQASRDHTERMLAHFGAGLRIDAEGDGSRRITISGDGELCGREVTVPGDPSSAAFPLAAALIVPGSEVTARGVLTNPTRTGFYETLAEMGADIGFANERHEGGEPVADIRLRAGPLAAVRVPAERAPRMIDEYPVLAVVAAFADGETRMEGLAELRVKECDRLAVTVAGLKAAGVDAGIDGDTLVVRGGRRVRGGARIATELDHRIAMAFLVLGLASDEPVVVDDVSMIATSFPGFRRMMQGLGADFGEPVETCA